MLYLLWDQEVQTSELQETEDAQTKAALTKSFSANKQTLTHHYIDMRIYLSYTIKTKLTTYIYDKV